MPGIEPVDWASPEYHSLYEESDVRTIFAHPTFVSAVRDAFGFVPESVILRRAGLQVALTTYRRRLGPFRRFTHPAFCYYSAVAASGLSVDQLSELSALREASGACRVQLPPLGGPPPGDRGYVSSFQTYVLRPNDLSPDNWSASRRRLFRKEQDSYNIRSGTALEIADWSSRAYVRHGRRPPFDKRKMIAFIGLLSKAGLARVYSIEHGADVVGSVAILADDRQAYYWLAGSMPGPAMTVLLGNVFAELATAGLQFDFLGANTPSIAEFKRRFGGSLVPHVHIHPEGAASRSLIRRIFGR
jgi:hypothetical protein